MRRLRGARAARGAGCAAGRVEFESGRVAAGGWGVTAAAVTAAVEGLGYAVRAVAPPAHAAPEPPTVATGEL